MPTHNEIKDRDARVGIPDGWLVAVRELHTLGKYDMVVDKRERVLYCGDIYTACFRIFGLDDGADYAVQIAKDRVYAAINEKGVKYCGPKFGYIDDVVRLQKQEKTL